MNNEIEEFFIIYAAYNEEKSLLPSFLSTKKSLDNYFSLNPKVTAHILIISNDSGRGLYWGCFKISVVRFPLSS